MSAKLPMSAQAQIGIWIGNKFLAQGKICYYKGKASYIADMSPVKVIRFCNGYAIAKRITDTFAEHDFNPQIIYTRVDMGQFYTTTRSKFTSKGILRDFGGHDQWILPLASWKASKGKVEVEKDYPTMDIREWADMLTHTVEDFTIPDKTKWEALRKVFHPTDQLERVASVVEAATRNSVASTTDMGGAI
jgi:hypothetical protein